MAGEIKIPKYLMAEVIVRALYNQPPSKPMTQPMIKDYSRYMRMSKASLNDLWEKALEVFNANKW